MNLLQGLAFPGSLPRRVSFAMAVWFSLLATMSALAATAGIKRAFDIPAGAAETTLRVFAEQASGQFIFSTDKVQGVRTRAVKGQFTARDALEAMVAETELRAVQDEATGALTVERVARTNASETAGIVELTPFEVTSARDLGYRAASSVTATGIGAKVANIPVNVGVVTNEFIQDWGGVELQDATKGISGFNSDPLNSNRAWLRGFESSRILQDGFEIGVGMMTDGVDRIEVIKGPSAIFHGEVNPAGVVNLISSRPTWRPEGLVRLSVGSYDFYRGYAQVSGPLIRDKLAYMVFGSYTDAESWDDHTMKRIKVAGGALTWRPIPKLKLTLDARVTDRTEIQPALLPFTHPAFLAAVQAGQVAPLTTARTWLNNNPLYGPNEPQSKLLVDDLLFKSRESNPANGNYPQTEDRQTIQAEAVYEHSRAANLRLVAFSTESERISGFYTSFRPVAGFNRDLMFAAAEHRFNYGLSEAERAGVKADLNLNASFWNITHNVLLGYEYNERESGSVSIATPATRWVPLVDPERDALAELRAANPNGFPRITARGRLTSDSFYVADQMVMFDEKLRLMAGVRHMALDVFTAGAAPRKDKQSKATPQFGLLFRPNELGAFYVNYSRSFESQLVVDVLGGVSGPITGEGIEAGVKTDWMEGRLSGTLGVYRIDRANIARRDTPRERELNIMPLWILGGEQRTEGLDLDLTYSPLRNLQFMLTYAHMWFAETIADQQTPQQVGVRLRHTPEHAVGLFGKYTFVQGPLTGFFVGASALYRSPFKWHDSWDVDNEITNYRQLDLLAGYKKRLRNGREWSATLNVDNVTNEERLDLQFFWADPVTWRFTLGYRF